MDPTLFFFHFDIYQKVITINRAEIFWAKMVWNTKKINHRRLTRKLHLPHVPENVFPGDFGQKKKGKNNGKKEKTTEYEVFMECEDFSKCGEFFSMCATSALECDKFGEFRGCVAGIETP